MLSAYDELYAYTMGRPGFILQHVVDAEGAQSATADGRPIRLVFSLVGLYLRVEKGFSGRAVQRVHARLGKRRGWPRLLLPAARRAHSRGCNGGTGRPRAGRGERRVVRVSLCRFPRGP